jgi:hypothetical protein
MYQAALAASLQTKRRTHSDLQEKVGTVRVSLRSCVLRHEILAKIFKFIEYIFEYINTQEKKNDCRINNIQCSNEAD